MFCSSSKCYFKGPWLLMPTEVPHTPTKLFYKQELFLSNVDGTHPIVAIVGKCAVLDYGDYICSEYIHFLWGNITVRAKKKRVSLGIFLFFNNNIFFKWSY